MLDGEMLKAMFVWPALASALLLAPLALPMVRKQRAVRMALLAASAIVGVAVAFQGILGTSPMEVTLDAKTRVLPVAALGLALGLLPRSAPGWLRFVSTALTGAVALRVLLASGIQSLWGASEVALILAASALALGALSVSVDRILDAASPKVGALGLAIIAAMPAPLMLFADSLALAQLHTAIAVVVALLVASVWFGAIASLALVRYFVVFATFALWVLAFAFANVSVTAFALLLLGLPLAALALQFATPSRPALLAFGGFALPVLCALVLGFLRYQEDVAVVPDDDVSYGYPS